ncbi:MAG: SDR family NAD(P)-dependent oxidoreductase [Deltaproteobacteria bacterium]|nr:SDR family NAD(P)-dependent oxidoreductase [Deltaproteobacteria bacterium]
MSRRFENQVVWITGGGTGIGRALALALAEEGAKVVVSGRRAAPLDQLASQHAAISARVCDVVDEQQVADTVASIVAEHGALHMTVANAGYAVAGGVEELALADWRRQFDVNLFGAVSTVKAALPHLRRADGRVVLVGSVMAFLGLPRNAPYSASKAALRLLGHALSAELHGSGVSCTTVHPGFVATDIYKVKNDGSIDDQRADRRPRKLIWSAERAAQVVLSAAHRRRRELVFTGHGKLGAFIGRHAPWLTHFAMTRAAGKKRTDALARGKASKS